MNKEPTHEPKETPTESVLNWRAKSGGTYHCITDGGSIESPTDKGDYIDDYRHSVGNYFQTEGEAEKYRDAKLEWNKFINMADWECNEYYAMCMRPNKTIRVSHIPEFDFGLPKFKSRTSCEYAFHSCNQELLQYYMEKGFR